MATNDDLFRWHEARPRSVVNEAALEKLTADPKWALFVSSKFTEVMEEFGPAPEVTYDFEAGQ